MIIVMFKINYEDNKSLYLIISPIFHDSFLFPQQQQPNTTNKQNPPADDPPIVPAEGELSLLEHGK
jgi:hypothetical protein